MMDTFEKLILIQKHFNLLKNKAKQTNKQTTKTPNLLCSFYNSAHFNHNLVMATKHQKTFFFASSLWYFF